jgi:hypothetical protein
VVDLFRDKKYNKTAHIKIFNFLGPVYYPFE